ncbi:MAG: hypothetical protein ACD_31C00005G0095 [uncultured bacterium]|uniref:Glycosyltransferase RgtA/B/C/D-like domain-containing protein n=2 Tax=Candidatus Daviesiibacteriota TaxID=1752718 RepID=A0A0G0I0B5_9BACT|nr:MAG: hypothetical protein ACD_31C00005G0095 [uncultured bacterium]KKQ09571.1 MAG: hypothetical protein US19_C0012G0005 [Candidatus Daviesbacteria bacterium GW2011_GWB1_36_5]OGE17784.1 MAG: hypothetical protein A2858_03505 [Candidatus Daviesbacteria bacterium RIFCSPHIGHO2_01_FULL_36_37]
MEIWNLISQYILLYFIFIVLALMTYYIPGFLIIKKSPQKLEGQEIISLSFCLGFVLFVLTAFFLAFLNLRVLMLPLLLVSAGFAAYKYKWEVFSPFKILGRDRILTILLLLAIFIQGIINFPSGFKYQDGMLFWSSQGHDGVWHIVLENEVKRGLPLMNPVFSGEELYNYHYLIDVVMGEYGRIYSFFNVFDLYFRFFPVLLSFMIGMGVYALVKRWQGIPQIAYLALFFTFFCGSFGYIVTYLRDGNILGGETVFWAAQGNTILGNPPHASSWALLPAFFLAYLFLTKHRNKFWFITAFLIGSILASFKVSGGVVMLAGLGVASIIDLIVNKKFTIVLLTAFLTISNYLILKSMTRGAEGFLMFLPWWFIRTMVVAGNRLDWIDLENKRQFYMELGGIRGTLRVLQFETTAFLIFLLGNMGMRVLGFTEIFRRYILNFKTTIFNLFEISLFVSMMTGLIIPLLFVQKGIIYNNIQFMQYYLLIFGFFAAISTYKILNLIKLKVFKVLVFLIIGVFSVPTVLGNINEFYGPNSNPLAIISNAELEALNHLKAVSGPDDVILNLPYNKYLQDKVRFQPKPIYTWYSTGYISALTERRTYLSSEEQVLIQDYPVEERREKAKEFFEGEDYLTNRAFLAKYNIKFVYLPKKELEKPFDFEKNGLIKSFENAEIIIYTVKDAV